MRITERGLAIVKRAEGLKFNAYRDTGGIWTIGWGHTKGVKEGDTCTLEQAQAWIEDDVRDAEMVVNAVVSVPLTQNQFDALVSFVFNEGGRQFGSSTMLRLLNAGDYAGVAPQFDRWIYDDGQVEPGLVTRRAAERALFELA